MGYKEQYAEAKKAKQAKKLNPEFITFDEKGKEIVGEFIDRHPVPGKKENEEYYQYLFFTDDGPVKFHLGSIADGEIGTQFEKGNVYAIKFLGKEELGGGRSVNKFDCYEVPVLPEK